MAQYAAMRALADHPEASASELARLCFVTRQSLQDLPAGLMMDVEAAMVRGISANDRRQLVALLNRCADNLERCDGD